MAVMASPSFVGLQRFVVKERMAMLEAITVNLQEQGEQDVSEKGENSLDTSSLSNCLQFVVNLNGTSVPKRWQRLQ